jgi:aryl-alcohol dehydrogenase-like predicted oxidoreductase
MSSQKDDNDTKDDFALSPRIPHRPYRLVKDSPLPPTVSIVGLGCSSFSGFFDAAAGGGTTDDDTADVPATPDWFTQTQTSDISTVDSKHPRVRQWVSTIHYAICEAGITLLDTAPWYGHGLSEQIVGIALEELFQTKSETDITSTTTKSNGDNSIQRGDIIVNTKVGRYEADLHTQFDFSATATQLSLKRSLARLRLSYIDVWQLHDPEFSPTLDVLLEECIPVMVQARREGHVRALGLTGYPLAVQRQIFQVTLERFPNDDMPRVWDQALTYGHYNLHDQTLLRQPDCFADYCQAHQCVCLAAAPLSMGLLTPTASPPEWHPASIALKEACQSAARLCEQHQVNLATLALLFALAEPRIATTLVGCRDVSQIRTLQTICARLAAVNFCFEDALTSNETLVYKTLSDTTEGPFATVWKSGEYHWDGLIQVQEFWQSLDTPVPHWQESFTP